MCLWKTPKIPSVSTTARELTPSTENVEPKSPIFGGSDSWKAKRRGAQALQINRGTGTNQKIDTGGWNI